MFIYFLEDLFGNFFLTAFVTIEGGFFFGLFLRFLHMRYFLQKNLYKMFNF